LGESPFFLSSSVLLSRADQICSPLSSSRPLRTLRPSSSSTRRPRLSTSSTTAVELSLSTTPSQTGRPAWPAHSLIELSREVVRRGVRLVEIASVSVLRSSFSFFLSHLRRPLLTCLIYFLSSRSQASGAGKSDGYRPLESQIFPRNSRVLFFFSSSLQGRNHQRHHPHHRIRTHRRKCSLLPRQAGSYRYRRCNSYPFREHDRQRLFGSGTRIRRGLGSWTRWIGDRSYCAALLDGGKGGREDECCAVATVCPHFFFALVSFVSRALLLWFLCSVSSFSANLRSLLITALFFLCSLYRTRVSNLLESLQGKGNQLSRARRLESLFVSFVLSFLMKRDVEFKGPMKEKDEIFLLAYTIIELNRRRVNF